MKSTIPLGSMASVEEIAEAVVWLNSDAAGFCIGHNPTLDGGQTVGLWQKE